MAEPTKKEMAEQMRALSAWLLGDRRGEHVPINRGQASKALLTAAALLDPVAIGGGVMVVDAPLPLVRQDEQYRRAVAIVLEAGRASVSMVQRKLNIRYSEAQALVARMLRDSLVSIEDTPGLPAEMAQAADGAETPQEAPPIWPIARLFIDSGGNIGGDSHLYAPGLPEGVHDVYPLPVNADAVPIAGAKGPEHG